MKQKIHYLTFILLVISFSLTAQTDTLQHTISGRQNKDEALNKPYVILISADGFRFDYAKKYDAKNILRLASEGISSKGMMPSFPSNTFPNHYTIVTGMYPSTHGLIDNTFYDPQRDEVYSMSNKTAVTDSSWYGGLPLWGLAEKNGTLAASLFWVSSESHVAGLPPTYYYKYHDKFSMNRKVEIIKEWLSLPERERPHFITLYFPEVDSQGHRNGPDAAATEEAVHQIDAAIGLLVEEVGKLKLPNVNYVFVSDHGMLQADIVHAIPLPTIDESKYVLINSYSLVRITAKDAKDIQPLYRRLKQETNANYKVYLSKRFPRRLHFRHNAQNRIGDILLVPYAPKVFANKDPKKTPYPGTHGFDAKKVPEMKASFYAWGPQFKSGKQIGVFKNIHIYPMIAKILQLPIPKDIDGKAKVLNPILIKKQE